LYGLIDDGERFMSKGGTGGHNLQYGEEDENQHPGRRIRHRGNKRRRGKGSLRKEKRWLFAGVEEPTR